MSIPETLTLLAEQSQARWGFALVADNNFDSAKANFDQALDLMATGNLRLAHEKAWKELWLQSKIEVTGPENLSRAVIGCMFYLLSAFPFIHDTSSSFGGVSPGGLSNGGDGQDYWGHVFWDQVGLVVVLSLHACYLCNVTIALFSLTGHLDVSWDRSVLPKFSPRCAGVQGRDNRWRKR